MQYVWKCIFMKNTLAANCLTAIKMRAKRITRIEWTNKAQKLKHINFDAQQIMMALNNVVVGFYTSSCQIEIYTAVIRCVANEIRRFLMLCVSNGKIIVWEHHLNWLLSTTPQIDHIYQLVNLSNRNDKAREREKLRFSLDCYR